VPEFKSKNSKYEKLDKPSADSLPTVINREGKITVVQVNPEGLPKTQP
jgi:hypothetical protein